MINDTKLLPLWAGLFIQKSGNTIHFNGRDGFANSLTPEARRG